MFTERGGTHAQTTREHTRARQPLQAARQPAAWLPNARSRQQHVVASTPPGARCGQALTWSAILFRVSSEPGDEIGSQQVAALPSGPNALQRPGQDSEPVG